MQKFKVLSEQVIITSKYSPTKKQIVELPGGETAEWYINTSNDAVVVVPLLKSGEVLLQRGYKHGSGEIITEFCAGLVDDGERPIEAAMRELIEETGHTGMLEWIGECFANPTGSTMKYHFFLAQNCEKQIEQQLDPAEQIELFTVKDLAAARSLLTKEGVCISAATLAALSMLNE